MSLCQHSAWPHARPRHSLTKRTTQHPPTSPIPPRWHTHGCSRPPCARLAGPRTAPERRGARRSDAYAPLPKPKSAPLGRKPGRVREVSLRSGSAAGADGQEVAERPLVALQPRHLGLRGPAPCHALARKARTQRRSARLLPPSTSSAIHACVIKRDLRQGAGMAWRPQRASGPCPAQALACRAPA